MDYTRNLQFASTVYIDYTLVLQFVNTVYMILLFMGLHLICNV